MTGMAKHPSAQLPLTLPHRPSSAREDLIVAPANALAAALIDAWPDWPGPYAVLVGPEGSGKTHLARVYAHAASAHVRQAASLRSMGDPQPYGAHFVIEDVRPGAAPERELFHLLNHVRAVHGSCLMTARVHPRAWNVALPDLASRLRTAQVAELGPPDDAQLSQVLAKLFSDRQMNVDPALIGYMVARMERSLGAARRLVAALDREALARKSPVTRALVADVLARGAGSREGGA
jgi:chromosomal replication initiation ATPase DnaA